MSPRPIRILSEQDLRRCVKLDLETIAMVEHAFRTLASGTVVMPPILSMELPHAHAEVDVKTAFVPGMEGFAIKVSSGFFDNPKLGLSSLNGLMIVFSARTGLVEAVLLDNGYLTDVRTAAAGAVAARHLAPADVETVGVLGAGVQARLQVEAAFLVRPFRRVLVWARDHVKATSCARDIESTLGVPSEATADADRLVGESQLVVTATPAQQPILRRNWLHPRLHITAIGSDQSTKNELEPEALAKADVYVCDRVSQASLVGELRSARLAGVLTQENPPELGHVVAGMRSGRKRQSDITVCDLTGTGAQDTAIANHAIKVAAAAGLGAIFMS